MSSRVVQINQLLEVIIEENTGPQVYRSRVEDIDEDTIYIALPVTKGVPVLLEPGTIFNARLIADGSVYHFESTYRNKKMLPIPVWIIDYPRNMRKIQRRGFLRIDSFLPVTLCVMPNEEDSKKEDALVLDVFTKDLSGGGARLITKDSLEVGCPVSLEFKVPENGLIQTWGEVVRVEKAAAESIIYWVSVRFTTIDEKERTKIVRFVFQKQLDRR